MVKLVLKSTINGKNVEPKEILELAKRNEVILIEGKALHEVLRKCLIQQTQREEKESTQPHENIVVGAPSSTIDEGITVEGRISSPQQAASIS